MVLIDAILKHSLIITDWLFPSPYCDLFIGIGISLLVLSLPNEVLDRIKNSVLPLFVREETTFPHPRFFEIINEDAIGIKSIDIFAHFHAHWLGITNKDDDTTGYYGSFYGKLFDALKEFYGREGRKVHENTPPTLRILFLDYSDCNEELREKVGDLLGIKANTPRSEIIREWGKETRDKFEDHSEEMGKMIKCGILHSESKIKYANFLPTMGMIRIVYLDREGKNSWVQAEILTHSKQQGDKVGSNRFTITFSGRDISGNKDRRIDLINNSIDGQWKKASCL